MSYLMNMKHQIKKYSQYKPDFTITNEGKRVYIEHFGISKDGKVPTFFAKPGQTIEDATKRYWEKIEWARELHKTNGTTLIETYSYQMKEETLYSELEKALKEVGVIFNPKSPEQIWQIIIEAADNEVSDMVTLFSTFLNLMKTNNYSIDDLFNKNDKIDDPNILNRNAIFLDIVKPIIKRYSNHLNLRKEIDFADLIAKATNYVLNEAIKLNYKYIIIDEYQDISMDRYHLINAIKTKIPSCKLFCVGDDWQSIFRFGGSDIGLFRNFEKYFGVTVASRIETTYRFSDPLIKASSQFILRNPNQINKELKSFSSNNLTTYDIRYSSSVESDDTLALQQIFDELILAVYEIEKRDILLLGRYNFDFNRIKNADNTFSINKKEQFIEYDTKTSNGAKIKIKTRFLTIHKSKGLEADIVIILNCNSGKYGFPSGVSDDEVLNLVLSEADQFENGEERRLFYVAMTRAKQKVIFITNTFYKSKFISEFVAGENDKTIRKCPICLTAELRTFSGETKGKAWTKHSCSNYRYGCDYTEWEPSLPNPANKMIESIDNQKEDVVKPKISNSGKDVRSPKISQAQPKVTPILGEFISNEEKPTEQILAKEINEKELLERSNTGRKVSFSFKFIPHETEVSTDSLDGSIIYKFKLSTKYKLATHLKIYRKDMFANMKDFKTIELANYPYAYEGSSFFLDESEMPILWLRK